MFLEGVILSSHAASVHSSALCVWISVWAGLRQQQSCYSRLKASFTRTSEFKPETCEEQLTEDVVSKPRSTASLGKDSGFKPSKRGHLLMQTISHVFNKRWQAASVKGWLSICLLTIFINCVFYLSFWLYAFIFDGTKMIFKLLLIILASHTGFPYLMDAKDIQIYIQTRGLKRQLMATFFFLRRQYCPR